MMVSCNFVDLPAGSRPGPPQPAPVAADRALLVPQGDADRPRSGGLPNLDELLRAVVLRFVCAEFVQYVTEQ
jgi:hypothetical protein